MQFAEVIAIICDYILVKFDTNVVRIYLGTQLRVEVPINIRSKFYDSVCQFTLWYELQIIVGLCHKTLQERFNSLFSHGCQEEPYDLLKQDSVI